MYLKNIQEKKYMNLKLSKKIKLGKKIISENSEPYLIAEVSCNHNGRFMNAKKLITLAKKSKADAVKFQTYTPDTITLKSDNQDFKIKSGLWKGKTLWDLYNKAQTPFSWFEKLFKIAKKEGIDCFSSPFDESAVDLLESLNCPFYKLASFELNHIPLIKKIAKTKKPIIISTGMANLSDIDLAVKTAYKNGSNNIIILYCVSSYPAQNSDFNLRNIKIISERYNCLVGLSDHSNNPKIITAAIAAGAKLVEKHIALPKQKTGFDIKFSLKGKEIETIKKEMIEAHELMGKNYFFRNKNELKNKIFRRSIYANKTILKDQIITKDDIKVIRPAFGLDPIFYDKIIGKKAKTNIKKYSRLKISQIQI